MWELLAQVDADGTINGYQRAANRILSAPEGLQPVRVRFVASFTVEPFLPTFVVEMARMGLLARCEVAPFNVVMQELLDPASGTATGGYDLVVVMRLLRDVCPELASGFLTLNPERVAELIGQTVHELETALTRFRERCVSRVIVHDFAQSRFPLLGIGEGVAAHSQSAAIRELNGRLRQALCVIPEVQVLDFDRVCARVGHDRCWDDTLWYLARAPLSAVVMPELARTQAVLLQAMRGQTRKCLVLDLDHTLWGGVIGEEGMAGLALGHTGRGLIFREFQEAVLELYHRGVLLALASKNNAADAMAVLREHPEMVLRVEHFAAMRIDWQPKPDNLAAMARELNIGIDSMVFFDDSPQERALMRAVHPQVLTPELPVDPMGYAPLLRRLGVFDKLVWTREDQQRGVMYQQQQQRAQLRDAAGSMEGFYRSLGMRAVVTPVDEVSLPRALDLLHKTNQFNLTTRRHDAQTLRMLLADPDCGIFVLRVVDKFGDNGLVGVGIVRLHATEAELDSFLMSCRVIGRTVETAFLCHLVEWARQRGALRMLADWIPTPKNQPVAQFLPEHGFEAVGRAGDEQGRWSLDLTREPVRWPEYIERGGV